MVATPGEGTPIGKGYGDVPRSWPPFSGQSPLPSPPIYHQCAALMTPFSIFRKVLDFQPCFGQNSSSLDPIFFQFSFPRPPIFKENSLPRPYIVKPAWHTSTKKKLSAPPGSQPCWNSRGYQFISNSTNHYKLLPSKYCSCQLWHPTNGTGFLLVS